ncbi:MAG: hypothetical protein GYB65_16820 [Chloroflexi bacterium]|nr:hypothetical protein [Chloroflexota bacterium]
MARFRRVERVTLQRAVRLVLVLLMLCVGSVLVLSAGLPSGVHARLNPTPTPDGSQPIQITTADIMTRQAQAPPPSPMVAPLPVEHTPGPGLGAPAPPAAPADAPVVLPPVRARLLDVLRQVWAWLGIGGR